MTADEIRDCPFGRMVRAMGPQQAYVYFWQCLYAGAQDNGNNISWELMEALGHDTFTKETVSDAISFLYSSSSERSYLRSVKS